jgi:hypothetical protein
VNRPTFADHVAKAAQQYERGEVGTRIDCFHLGRVTNRLGCNCPKRWRRRCDLYGQTSLTECRTCPDYEP